MSQEPRLEHVPNSATQKKDPLCDETDTTTSSSSSIHVTNNITLPSPPQQTPSNNQSLQVDQSNNAKQHTNQDDVQASPGGLDDAEGANRAAQSKTTPHIQRPHPQHQNNQYITKVEPEIKSEIAEDAPQLTTTKRSTHHSDLSSGQHNQSRDQPVAEYEHWAEEDNQDLAVVDSRGYIVIPNRVHLKGLSSNTTENELRHAYSRFGQVTDVLVGRTFNGQAKNFAFLSFDNAESAQACITGPPVVVSGREVHANYATKAPETAKQLKLVNIPQHLTREDLIGFYRHFGELEYIKLLIGNPVTNTNPRTGKVTNFGFVSFKRPERAFVAIKYNSHHHPNDGNGIITINGLTEESVDRNHRSEHLIGGFYIDVSLSLIRERAVVPNTVIVEAAVADALAKAGVPPETRPLPTPGGGRYTQTTTPSSVRSPYPTTTPSQYPNIPTASATISAPGTYNRYGTSNLSQHATTAPPPPHGINPPRYQRRMPPPPPAQPSFPQPQPQPTHYDSYAPPPPHHDPYAQTPHGHVYPPYTPQSTLPPPPPAATTHYSPHGVPSSGPYVVPRGHPYEQQHPQHHHHERPRHIPRNPPQHAHPHPSYALPVAHLPDPGYEQRDEHYSYDPHYPPPNTLPQRSPPLEYPQSHDHYTPRGGHPHHYDHYSQHQPTQNTYPPHPHPHHPHEHEYDYPLPPRHEQTLTTTPVQTSAHKGSNSHYGESLGYYDTPKTDQILSTGGKPPHIITTSASSQSSRGNSSSSFDRRYEEGSNNSMRRYEQAPPPTHFVSGGGVTLNEGRQRDRNYERLPLVITPPPGQTDNKRFPYPK